MSARATTAWSVRHRRLSAAVQSGELSTSWRRSVTSKSKSPQVLMSLPLTLTRRMPFPMPALSAAEPGTTESMMASARGARNMGCACIILSMERPSSGIVSSISSPPRSTVTVEALEMVRMTAPPLYSTMSLPSARMGMSPLRKPMLWACSLYSKPLSMLVMGM